MQDLIIPAVRDLIVRHLASMDHVEVLVLLATRAPERLTAERAAQATHLDVMLVSACLAELASARILAREKSLDGPAFVFVYAPAEPALRDAVTALVRLYNERPVTLVRAIYERPASRLVSFSDAFRLKPADE